MDLVDCTVGLGITGSFCTFARGLEVARVLSDKCKRVVPVFSYNTQMLNTRFTSASDFMKEMVEITGESGIRTIQGAEEVGPGKLFDLMVIYPCTGNTLSKLINGIVDTPVLMAAKAHLRNQRPLVVGVSTNDGLGINFMNIGRLMNQKNIYMIPFGQDDCLKKPNSLVCHKDLVLEAMRAALDGEQVQPVIV